MPQVTPTRASEPGTMMLGPQSRTFGLNTREIDIEARTVPLSFSSEEPYERWWGVEILGHAPTEVDMTWMSSGRAPLLADHDMRQQIGVFQSAEISTDRKGRAVVKFGKSPRAEQEFQDVIDGVRSNVSVGYVINAMELVKQDGDLSTYRVTEWMPYEGSLVAVPADMTVGVGRAANDGRDLKPVRVTRAADLSPPSTVSEPTERQMPEINTAASGAEQQQRAAATAREEGMRAEQQRHRDIMALATRHNMRDFGDKHVGEGTPIEAFRGLMLDELAKRGGGNAPLENPPNAIGLSNAEARSFSVTRYLRSLAENNPSLAEFETAAVRTVREQFSREGLQTARSGNYLPYEVMSQPLPGLRVQGGNLMIGDRVVMAQRDLSTATTAAGGAVVATDLLATDFITLLRNAILVRRMGARVLSGLRGNVDIPRQIGSVTPGWYTQGSAASESDAQFGKVSLTPKTVHTMQDVTRELLMQSTPAIEGLIRLDMVDSMAVGIDWASLNGSGSGGQVLGLFNTAGIGAEVGGTNGAAPTWDNIVNLESLVANANAATGAMGYLTNTKARGKLKRTQKFSGTNGQTVWEDPMQGDDPSMFGRLNGYRCGVTNNVRSDMTKGSAAGVCSGIAYGNWSDLLIGEWGAAEIVVDQLTQAANRIVRFHIWQTVDVGVRRGQSFATMNDALTV